MPGGERKEHRNGWARRSGLLRPTSCGSWCLLKVDVVFLSLLSKKVKGKTLTLKVAVPAGGKLRVSGQGLSSTTKTVGGRETITVTVHQRKGGKLSTSVKVTFTPFKGHKQLKSAKLHFSR